jgi:hypothetical protein
VQARPKGETVVDPKVDDDVFGRQLARTLFHYTPILMRAAAASKKRDVL